MSHEQKFYFCYTSVMSLKLTRSEIIKSFPTNQIYKLRSVDQEFLISDKIINQIVAICSQSLIYEVLFNEKLKGKPYKSENALIFLNWAKEGWSKNKWFVYLITNESGDIVGAVDIKSNNLESAEIGYWMAQNIKGVMTNAVIKLREMAKAAGYKSLYGLTVPDNIKSQNVLTRAGFQNIGKVREKAGEHVKFLKIL